ncbi:MAG: lectin [Acidobacteriota bacterium]|nr:lectin [Acidobacteriota bacterium]
MKKACLLSGLAVLTVVLSHTVSYAQQSPPEPMSFFITSVGVGDGANLGGLAGADAHCQSLAEVVGRGDATWRAYLSSQGENAVNARDRIGSGPWYAHGGRRRIAQDVGELHGDTLAQARLGNGTGKHISLTEQGTVVNGIGDSPNEHDILTGSRPDGRAYADGADHTCSNWTSNGEGSAQIGHSDKQGGGNGSWNSSHPTRGCSQDNLVSTGGAGLFYCFATNE